MCSGARAVTEIWSSYSGRTFVVLPIPPPISSGGIKSRLRGALSATYLSISSNFTPSSLLLCPSLRSPDKVIIDVSDTHQGVGSSESLDNVAHCVTDFMLYRLPLHYGMDEKETKRIRRMEELVNRQGTAKSRRRVAGSNECITFHG